MTSKDTERGIDSIFIPLPRVDIAPATNPRSVLDRALLDARVTDIASMLFLQWDAVRVLFERMAWLLTNDLPHPSGQPLLQVILVQSIQEFGLQISRTPEDQTGAYVAMLRQAFALLPCTLEIEVRGKKGEIWDPLQAPPLGEWILRHGPVAVDIATELPEAHKWTHPSQIRYAFLHRLLDKREIQEILPLIPHIISSGRALH